MYGPIFSVSTIIAFLIWTNLSFGQNQKTAPLLRAKLGVHQLKFQVGNRFSNESLGSFITYQPTVLWTLPTFRSRLGIHFLGDFGSPYGLMPISGIGLTGYFYPLGVSSAYEVGPDNTVIQISKPSFFTFGCLTPLNFNLNRQGKDTADGSSLSFSAFMYEFAVGAGYDYPFTQNMIFAVELSYRSASAQSSTTNQTFLTLEWALISFFQRLTIDLLLFHCGRLKLRTAKLFRFSPSLVSFLIHDIDLFFKL